MNKSVNTHLNSIQNILDLILSEYFDQQEPDDADLDLDKKLLEFLIYRALDHVTDCKKLLRSSAAD